MRTEIEQAVKEYDVFREGRKVLTTFARNPKEAQKNAENWGPGYKAAKKGKRF